MDHPGVYPGLQRYDDMMFVDHVLPPWDVDRGRKVAMSSLDTCQ